ncbi:MAG: 30S ribosomal protein S3, partial [Thermoplasmata archaeon]
IVRRIMDSGAKGCQVILSGKLTGQRHRTEKFREGHIKYCGHPKLMFMREGYTAARLKPGIIGVKVWIMDPNARLPDDVLVTAQPTATATSLEAGSPGELSTKEELSIAASEESESPEPEPAPAPSAEAAPEKTGAEPVTEEAKSDEQAPEDESKNEGDSDEEPEKEE